MIGIIQKDNKILRLKAKEVLIKDIKSKNIIDIIQNMKEALQEQDDGVAIAAPQIGESLRIFVVSGKATRIMEEKDELANKDLPEENSLSQKEYPYLTFINPKILKTSKKKNLLEEGCLSVRHFYGKVPRANKITIKACDEEGLPFSRGASGLLAQIFQHEIDHLEGVLFIDKAQDLIEVRPKSKNL